MQLLLMDESFAAPLPIDGQREILEYFGALCAKEYIASAATRDYYWNLTGAQTGILRATFKKHCRWFQQRHGSLTAFIDGLVPQLGGRPGLSDEVCLTTPTGVGLSGEEMLSRLIFFHERIIRQLDEGLAMAAFQLEAYKVWKFLHASKREHERMIAALRFFLEAKRSSPRRTRQENLLPWQTPTSYRPMPATVTLDAPFDGDPTPVWSRSRASATRGKDGDYSSPLDAANIIVPVFI